MLYNRHFIIKSIASHEGITQEAKDWLCTEEYSKIRDAISIGDYPPYKRLLSQGLKWRKAILTILMHHFERNNKCKQTKSL